MSEISMEFYEGHESLVIHLMFSNNQINCPVVAIHGKYDTHPIDGVNLALKYKLKI